jgi:membrane fusion protein, multidrug efflux system
MRLERFPSRLVATVAAAMFVAGCTKDERVVPPPPPQVGVISVHQQSVPVMTELPGRTSAYLVAQVRARVDGIILAREFTEGSEVKAGQRLYKIDPAPYVAALDSAKAGLARAQANLVSTTAQANRYKILVTANAVSKQDYDNAVAAEGQALADVAAGKAAVETAQINLGYTDVTSPVTGRVGISNVTPGAYVQASQATLLSTVQQINPVYVDLTQSSLEGLKLRRDVKSGRVQVDGPNAVKVTLILEDGRPYQLQGRLQFTDVTVDESTGSVTLRAIFPNPDGELLPGMFVRARIEGGVSARAYLLPQVAIQHNSKGEATALVVDAAGKVATRTLTTEGMADNQWVVDGGLNAGDRVVVDGVDKVRDGQVVTPTEVRTPSPSPAVSVAGIQNPSSARAASAPSASN